MEQLIRPILDQGYLAYFLMGLTLFTETGLLVGFFLPGDTLLLSVGLYAATGKLSLPISIVSCFVGAVLGNSLGYWLGYKYGDKVFSRPESKFFKPEYVEQGKELYRKYGALALILSRFVPLVRAVVPTFAGVIKMDYRVFTFYNILGAAIWTVSLTLLGYFLGKLIPLEVLDKYIMLMIGAAVGIPLLLAVFKLLKK